MDTPPGESWSRNRSPHDARTRARRPARGPGLRRAGCRAVLLEVRASNTAAQSLYAAHGFTRIGLRRRYYQVPQEDAVVMRALLRPAPAPVGS